LCVAIARLSLRRVSFVVRRSSAGYQRLGVTSVTGFRWTADHCRGAHLSALFRAASCQIDEVTGRPWSDPAGRDRRLGDRAAQQTLNHRHPRASSEEAELFTMNCEFLVELAFWPRRPSRSSLVGPGQAANPPTLNGRLRTAWTSQSFSKARSTRR